MKNTRCMLMYLIPLMLISVLTGCMDFGTRKMTLDLKSAHYLNPNQYGHAAPIHLTVYQLKQADAFQQASFIQLSRTPEVKLGAALIDRIQIELPPNATQRSKIVLSPETQYIGLAADYRSFLHSKWKSLIKLKSKTKSIQLTVRLDAQSIHVQQDS